MAQENNAEATNKEAKTKKNNNNEEACAKKPWWKTALKWLGITAVAGGTFYGGYKVGYNKGRKSTTIK